MDQLSAKMESVNRLLTEVENDPEAKNFLETSSQLWMPVITASAEERRAAASSHPSAAPPPPTATANKDGTESRDSE